MSGWLDQAAVLEPMKIVLPRSSGRASASRTQRNALRTSVCQKTENVSQVWRRVGRCGPVAPAFRTRTGGRSWGTPTGTPRGRAALGSASPPRAPPSYGARAARSSGERVRLRDGPEPAGARLGAPRLRRAVDGHQAEGGAVAEDPLEVVEQAPVDVAAHGDPVGEAGEHAPERAPDELDALGIVLGPDTVPGDP